MNQFTPQNDPSNLTFSDIKQRGHKRPLRMIVVILLLLIAIGTALAYTILYMNNTSNKASDPKHGTQTVVDGKESVNKKKGDDKNEPEGDNKTNEKKPDSPKDKSKPKKGDDNRVIEKKGGKSGSQQQSNANGVNNENTIKTFHISKVNASAHNAFPVGAKLNDGTILIVFRGAKNHYGSKAKGRMYEIRSRDNGRTWTKPKRIAVNELGKNHETPNGVGPAGLIVPKSGPLKGKPVLVYVELVPSAGGTLTRVVIANNTKASSWGQPQEITFNNQVSNSNYYVTQFASSPPVEISSDKNSNTMIFGGYTRVYDRKLRKITSDWIAMSRLATWRNGRWSSGANAKIAYYPSGNWKFTETVLSRLKDGRLLAMTRVDDAGSYGLSHRKSFSTDNGKTWTNHQYAYLGQGLPATLVMSNGKIVVSYRHWIGQQNNGHHWAVYRTSSNGGVSWSPEVRYGSNPKKWMSYAALIEYAPGKVLSVWSKEDNQTRATLQVDYLSP